MVVDKGRFEIALAAQKETIEGLSQKSGLTKKTIHNLRNEKNVAPKTVGVIAEALRTSVAELVKMG